MITAAERPQLAEAILASLEADRAEQNAWGGAGRRGSGTAHRAFEDPQCIFRGPRAVT